MKPVPFTRTYFATFLKGCTVTESLPWWSWPEVCLSTAIYQGVTVQGAPFTVTWVAVTVTCPGQDGVVLADGVRVNSYLVLSLPRALHKMGLFQRPWAWRLSRCD